MININELEESVLIESNDFDMNITQLIASIQIRAPRASKAELYKTASSIIGSLVLQKYVTLIKTRYEKEDDECYAPLSDRNLSKEEVDTLLAHPEQWDELDVSSKIEPVEIRITEKGRRYLYSC